ncbi:MAG: hypothetical protein ABR577_10015 [Pyrinomonadaceae bacterium]
MKIHITFKHLAFFGLTLCVLFAISGATPPQAFAQGRDPFAKYKPPPPRKRQMPKVAPPVVVVTPPSVQERVDKYKEQKAAARDAQQPAPKATTAMLLSELQVVGIFRTPRGYAAMVEATPIKFNYVIYPGEKFYDGQLVAIEDNRLVFRRETRWTNGRVDMAVEMKPLRKPDAVSDSLAATRGNSAGAPAEGGKAKEEKSSRPEKP